MALAKTEDSIAELSRVQQRMLDHAIEILAPGGILVFCTCSLEPEERRASCRTGSGSLTTAFAGCP